MCGWGGNGWMWNGGWGWGGWIVTAVVLTVVFALVITAVVLTIRCFTGGGHRGPGGPQQVREADDVLAERFARGEIDDDEYRRRLTLLHQHHG